MQGNSKENQRDAAGAYRFAGFDLYPSERQLYRENTPITLAPKAFDALLVLVRKAGQLVRKAELVDELWPDAYVSEANLTNTIVILRKALGRDAIQTVSKYGYRFMLPVLGEPGIEPRVYENFVRARALANARSLESMVAARDLYWLCIAEDPEFAAAWAWLGRCLRFLEKFGREPAANFELARAAFRRALAIDPDLACAHQFFTQLQVDCGESQEAMVRLLQRLHRNGQEPESFAGLVQVLRCRGLLDESIAAHARAHSLDPAIMTSVTHSHFARGDYQAAMETYGAGKGYYLDAAAWAALGDTKRAISLLRERLSQPQLSPLIAGLMGSLLAVLEGRGGEAVQIMQRTEIAREPETQFYFARHFAMLGHAAEGLALLDQARIHGFTVSKALALDPLFAPVRKHPGFARFALQSTRLEDGARRAFEQAGGPRLCCANSVP